MNSKTKTPLQDHLIGYPLALFIGIALVHGWAKENADNFIQKQQALNTEHGIFTVRSANHIDLRTSDNLRYVFDLNASTSRSQEYKPIEYQTHTESVSGLTYEWVTKTLCAEIPASLARPAPPEQDTLTTLAFAWTLPGLLDNAALAYRENLERIHETHCQAQDNAQKKTAILTLAPE